MDSLVRHPEMEKAAVSSGFIEKLTGIIRDRASGSKLRCVACKLLGVVASHSKDVLPSQAVLAAAVIGDVLKSHFADASEAEACCYALRDLVQLKEPRVRPSSASLVFPVLLLLSPAASFHTPPLHDRVPGTLPTTAIAGGRRARRSHRRCLDRPGAHTHLQHLLVLLIAYAPCPLPQSHLDTIQMNAGGTDCPGTLIPPSRSKRILAMRTCSSELATPWRRSLRTQS